MMHSIKNIYFTVFLLFFRFCHKAWSHEMNINKGVVGVTIVQGWLLVGTNTWLYYATGNKSLMAIPKPFFFLFFALLFALNYYALVRHGRAEEFNGEFSKFPTRRKVFLIAAGVGLILLSFGFMFVSASYIRPHRNY
jgi:hypothetical protein